MLELVKPCRRQARGMALYSPAGMLLAVSRVEPAWGLKVTSALR